MTLIKFETSMDAEWFRSTLHRRAAIAETAGEWAHADDLERIRALVFSDRLSVELNRAQAVIAYTALFTSLTISELLEAHSACDAEALERHWELTNKIKEAI